MTAPVCPTSGCGGLTAFVDASTRRSDDWLRVQPARQPQQARLYCSAVCAAAALAGTPDQAERAVRTRLAADIDAAERRLAGLYPGDPAMLARCHGLQTARRIVAPDRPVEDVACCWLCGCTEDDACAGGCHWIPDPTGIRDVCSTCADPVPCGTRGCGTDADLDANNPELWGWIRIEVAGTGTGARWYCTPWCVDAAIARAAAELAADSDTTAEVTR